MAHPLKDKPSVQEMEQTIARAFVKSALALGYVININNGGDDDEIELSSNEEQILEAMFATDDEYLHLTKEGSDKRTRWCRFVYGNDGYDVICDYTTNLEEDVMPPVTKVSDAYARLLGYTEDEDGVSYEEAKVLTQSMQLELAPGTVEGLDSQLTDKLKKMLQYSFKDTNSNYDQLTSNEKDIISKDDFDKLSKWSATSL